MNGLLNQHQLQTLEANDLLLRLAIDQDSDVIKKLIFKILKEHQIEDSLERVDGKLHAIASNYHKNGGKLWVIEHSNGEIIATLSLLLCSLENKSELRKMYIKKAYRGIGLGKLLLELAIAWSLEQKLTKISLETASALKSAITLYKKYGFTEIPFENNAVRCDRQFELLLNSEARKP